jgi:hypothetical protein
MRTLFIVLTLFSFIALLSQTSSGYFANIESKIEKTEQENELEDKPRLETEFIKTHSINNGFIIISLLEFPNYKNPLSEFLQNKVIKPPQV